MSRTGSRAIRAVGRWVGGVALLAGLTTPAAVLAQMPTPGAPVTMPPSAVPKFPAQLPSPTPAPGSAAAPAQPSKAEPAKTDSAQPSADGRDPFDPLVTRSPDGGNRPSLTGLRLVGVVWDPARRDKVQALVETPDGLGYYVRVNEEKFGGKVVAIERDRVRFSVREQDPGGQVRVRTVELKLSQ
jgi:Tfp pilus assembly protein PilP